MFFKSLVLAIVAISPGLLASSLKAREDDDPKVTIHSGFPCNDQIAEIKFDKCTEFESDWVGINLDEGTECEFFWYPNCTGQGPPKHTGPECFYFRDNPSSLKCSRT